VQNIYVKIHISISPSRYDTGGVEMSMDLPDGLLDKINIPASLEQLWQAALCDYINAQARQAELEREAKEAAEHGCTEAETLSH
jgi:hypothetical protein